MYSEGDEAFLSATSRSEASRDRTRRRLRTASNPPVLDASHLLGQFGVRLADSGEPSFDEQSLKDLDFVLARVQAAMQQPRPEPEDQTSIPPSDLTETTDSAGPDDTLRDSTCFSEQNGFRGAPTTISSRHMDSTHHADAQEPPEPLEPLGQPVQQPQLIQKTVRLDNAELVARLICGFVVNKVTRMSCHVCMREFPVQVVSNIVAD